MALPRQPGEQLALEVQLRDDATLDDFAPHPGLLPLLEQLSAAPGANSEQSLFVYGAAGCGKSHLLQAACHSAGVGSVYLPLADIRGYEPDSVLAGMDSLQRICVDDIHLVCGDEAWETALFHLINRSRGRGCQLVFAADCSPRQLDLNLADLRSRLSWGLVFRLPQADDEQLAAILLHRAGRRGLQMSPEVARYIVTRARRDTDGLIRLLDVLDRASLSQQRLLSIPFVRATLDW